MARDVWRDLQECYTQCLITNQGQHDGRLGGIQIGLFAAVPAALGTYTRLSGHIGSYDWAINAATPFISVASMQLVRIS